MARSPIYKFISNLDSFFVNFRVSNSIIKESFSADCDIWPLIAIDTADDKK